MRPTGADGEGAPAPLRGAAAAAAEGPSNRRSAKNAFSEATSIFPLRPLLWDYQGRAALDSWVQRVEIAGTFLVLFWCQKRTSHAGLQARRNRCDLAALNTRHLLRKPVCGLKAPLGLSCPPGTAVLSGSLLSVKREHLRPVKHFPENPKLSLSVQKTFLSLHRSTQKVASCRIDTESLTKNIIFCILSLSALA